MCRSGEFPGAWRTGIPSGPATEAGHYLDHWRNSVEQRLGQLDRLYGLVHVEINDRRMLLLEIVIVVFFAIDLLALFFPKR